MSQIKKILIATSIILEFQMKNQYVADFVLHKAVEKSGLTWDECREIRDEIQSPDMEFLWIIKKADPLREWANRNLNRRMNG